MQRGLRTGLMALAGMVALWMGLLGGPTPARAAGGVHIVVPGETLSEIAQKHGVDVAALRRLNDLQDADFIWAGQRLELPPNTLLGEDDPGASGEEGTSEYIVQAGDDLLSIANAHRIGLAQLLALNHIAPAQRLVAGQMLVVPAHIPAPTLAPGLNDPDRAEGTAQVQTEISEDGLPVYVVQPGEHLGIIAARFGTTPRAIAAANDLVDPSLIVPGQSLVIAPLSQAEKAAMSTAVGADGYHVHTEYPTTTEKWIDVDLSEQRVVAYEGTTAVKAFIVSTGLPATPTVTGTFRIWAKTPLQDMSGGNRAAGDYYYLEDVPWVQYFYEDYSFHGTYWHNNFGRPMSRGCVNMTIADAKWLFDWASPTVQGGGWFLSDEQNPGTLVLVHP